MERSNWAGNYTYRATRLHRPATLDQVREIVGSARRLRVLGSRHSFTDIGDSSDLLTLDGLPDEVVVDSTAGTVSFRAGLRYGDLAGRLSEHGMALANLASLPHISVGGAIATATHGSGVSNRNLATAVAALEMVTSDGEVITARRGEPDFNGLVVGLGALGAVTRITLDVEPAYRVRQRVFDGLRWEALYEHFDAIASSGYSVSAFARWGDTVDHVWVKSRVPDGPDRPRGSLFGAVEATGERHPIPGLDPATATPQLGVPGPWSERLPHFRMGFTPSSGEEIQSEYLVPRAQAVAAIEAVRALADTVRPLLLVSEIRWIAADELWMSPQYGRDTIGIHFTWRREPQAVERALVDLEAALMPLGARPHWGKLFMAEADAIAPLYERLADFTALMQRTDPRCAFRNHWLRTHLLERD